MNNKYFSYKCEEVKDVKIKYTKGIYSIDNNEVPFLSFNISGLLNNKEISYNFSMNYDEAVIYSLDDGQYDINELIFNIDSKIKLPNKAEDDLNLLLPEESDNDMYNDVSSFWIQKKDANNFLFKVSIPSAGIFTYFEFNLDK